MATYNRQFKWNPPRRKKQRYALIERVVDFSKAPITAGNPDDGQAGNLGSDISTAWAAGDVLEAIQIRAGQTVLGVQVEVMQESGTANTYIKVGYGSDNDFWGRYNVSKKTGTTLGFFSGEGTYDNQQHNFGYPLYFASADTIDLTINQAITAGKIRVIAHLLEDDR